MNNPVIHQEHTFEATPERIYAVLTEADTFSALSGGAPASIDPSAGGAFSCFGGMIEGRNVECVPGERLVQAWRAKNWDPGVYSIVRFELRSEGARTRVLLDHSAFPKGQGEHLAQGWTANYWGPLTAFLSA